MSDTKPENMDLKSMDIAQEKRDALKQLFPEVFTEDKIDFEQLRRVMGDWVEPGKERYGLNWPGKAECMKVIQAPSIATLKPAREESVNFDETENLFIEGDNLEVLKLLQKAYFGKIKMIYIDPPYNKGKEFIYPDKFSETLETYLQYTGQKDAEGKKFSTNPEKSGRYHSRWLSMMYPRLYLARNLLTEDGCIFISIDDIEHANLRHLCDQVFGSENFIASIMWEKTRKNDARFFSAGHDYMLCYAKSEEYLREKNVYWREEKAGADDIYTEFVRLQRVHKSDYRLMESELRQFYRNLPKDHPAKKHSRYNKIDERGVWRDDNMSWPGGGGPAYDVIHPKTGKPCEVPPGGWRYSTAEKMQEMIEAGTVVFREDHTEPPIRKTYLVRKTAGNEDADENIGKQVMGTYFYRSALQASNLMNSLLGENVFDNPKDHEVIARLISYVTDENDVILDFFAGSGTTAHSVIDLNVKRNSSRKFITVQLPENIGENEPAFKMGYRNIAEISIDRIRKASRQLIEENSDFAGDTGLRVFKLSNSNFKLWDGTTDQEDDLAKQLELHVDHIDQESSAEDILYELLLKAGFELTTKVEKKAMAGKDVYAVSDGAMLICLDKAITSELIDALADANPLQVICLDEGFKGNDQLKTNAVQTFKSRAKEDEEPIVFRTV